MFIKPHKRVLLSVLLCLCLLVQLPSCGISRVGDEISSFLENVSQVSGVFQSAAETGTPAKESSGEAASESGQQSPEQESSAPAVSTQESAEDPSKADVGGTPQVDPSSVQEATTPPPQKIEVNEQAEPQDFNQVPSQSGTQSGGYAYAAQVNGYLAMNTAAQRQAYDLMREAVYQVTNTANQDGYYPVAGITLQGTRMGEAEIRKAVSAFKNDTPQVFWLANVFGYVYSGGNTVIKLYSVLPAAACNDAIHRLQSAAESAVSAVRPGLSEFDRELCVHRWLASHCTYDSAAAEYKNEWQAFTAYGALVEQNAVCEGYARAMQLLLSYAGMQCALVSGTGQGGAHMWNLVEVQQAWYHLDATWDDAQDLERYDYFNVTDSQISNDHTIAPDYSSLTAAQVCGSGGASFNLSLPACSTETYNYFNQKAVKLNSLGQESDTRAVQTLCDAVRAGENTVCLQVGSALDYDDTMGRLFSHEPYKFFYYIKEANKQLDAGHQISWERVTYSRVPVQRAVTVQIYGQR